MDNDKAISDLTRLYNMIVGKKYRDLNDNEKRIAYAVKLWSDGMEVEQVVTEMIEDVTRNLFPPVWVDQQLRDTFGYTDDTEVPAL